MTQEEAMNMSNEQAIKLLQSMMLMMCDQHGCPVSDVYFALEKAVEALTGQQWIPYSESSKKLPEDRQRCLVTIRDGREPEVDIVGYATNLNEVSLYDLPDSKPGWYGFDSEYGYYEQTGVTAWMPLPESYREEGEK